MFDYLRALITLADSGTMAKAATALKVTQSAVSKRIQKLEDELGRELVEQEGRNVKFTQEGLDLVARTRPLMADLREVLYTEAAEVQGRIVMAVGDSLLSSWGAAALACVEQSVPGLALEINSHRGRVALDRVASAEYMLALVPGRGELVPDLRSEVVCEEPMVIVPSELQRFRFPKSGELPVISCEPQEATWTAIGGSVRRYSKRIGVNLKVTKTIQTFSAVAKLAEAGFGHGFLPLGVAKSFGYSAKQLVTLPSGGVKRPVSLVGRKNTFGKPLVQEFFRQLQQHLDKEFASR